MNKIHSPAQKVAGGTHLSRIDVRHGDHPAAKQHGNLVGINFIILGLAAVDGFPACGRQACKVHVLKRRESYFQNTNQRSSTR